MKFEFFLILITGFVVMNIYHDGKYLKLLTTWKKYYKMAFVCFMSFSFYLFIKKEPRKNKNFMSQSADFIKYMPLDRNTSRMLNPIVDLTRNREFFGSEYITPQQRRLMNSGGSSIPNMDTYNNYNKMPKRHKRSVSETKKKFVAAGQHWKCGHCSNELSAWFEVDHKVKLEDGGSNHVDNLVALCRECHGKKTGLENL